MYKGIKFFSFPELIVTETSLPNLPTNMAHVENLCCLCDILNEIREKYEAPVVVNSAFRTPAVNNAVGGVPRSLHLQGRAADIRPNYYPSQDYYKNLQALKDVVKTFEDRLSEIIYHQTYIHIAL